MWRISAPLRCEPGSLARLIHLLVQAAELIVRRDAGPQHSRFAAPLEAPQTVQGDFERRVVDAGKSGDEIRFDVAVDLADEAERQVELVVALPAGATDPAHDPQQLRPDRLRRADRDEQAGHIRLISADRGGGKPDQLLSISLETRPKPPDIMNIAAPTPPQRRELRHGKLV
jgi:hypothetical protein